MKKQPTAGYGYLSDKKALLARLARIEGQVRGVSQMVDNERYCIDILTQLSAVQTALRTVGLEVLGGHAKSCVTQAFVSGNPQMAETKTAELLEAVERFIKAK